MKLITSSNKSQINVFQHNCGEGLYSYAFELTFRRRPWSMHQHVYVIGTMSKSPFEFIDPSLNNDNAFVVNGCKNKYPEDMEKAYQAFKTSQKKMFVVDDAQDLLFPTMSWVEFWVDVPVYWIFRTPTIPGSLYGDVILQDQIIPAVAYLSEDAGKELKKAYEDVCRIRVQEAQLH